MSRLVNITTVLLFSLSGLGYYLTWYIYMHNGGAPMMKETRDNRPHILPYNDGAPLRKTYTGIAPVDYQLTVLVLFFYNIVDGSHPNACLQIYHFIGQAFAGYSLLVMEGLRYGNRWKVISFITLWGLAFQLASFAVVVPLYFAIHLSISPTAGSRGKADFLMAPHKLMCIPYSVALGLIAPTVAVALPAPSIMTYERKQMLIAIWQAFPAWVGILQQILPLVANGFTNKVAVADAKTHTLSKMRIIYLLMLALAVVVRVSAWTISISAVLFPSIFAPDVVQLLTPSAVFRPRAATPTVKMPSIAAASLQLLQYDEMVGAAAMVMWSAALYINTSERKGLGDWLSLIVKGIGIEALAGPHGFAVAAVWARDEIIFADDNTQKKDV